MGRQAGDPGGTTRNAEEAELWREVMRTLYGTEGSEMDLSSGEEDEEELVTAHASPREERDRAAGSAGPAREEMGRMVAGEQLSALKEYFRELLLEEPDGDQEEEHAARLDALMRMIRSGVEELVEQSVQEFYEAFEATIGLANDGEGMTDMEKLTTLKACLKQHRLKTYDLIYRRNLSAGVVREDPGEVYRQIRAKHLLFSETSEEKEIRILEEGDGLEKGKLSAFQWEVRWESHLADRESVGLGLNPKEALIQYLRKIGPTGPGPGRRSFAPSRRGKKQIEETNAGQKALNNSTFANRSGEEKGSEKDQINAQGSESLAAKVCYDMRDKGACSRGKNCKYSHDRAVVEEARKKQGKGKNQEQVSRHDDGKKGHGGGKGAGKKGSGEVVVQEKSQSTDKVLEVVVGAIRTALEQGIGPGNDKFPVAQLERWPQEEVVMGLANDAPIKLKGAVVMRVLLPDVNGQKTEEILVRAKVIAKGLSTWHGLILGGRALDAVERGGLGFRPAASTHIFDALGVRLWRKEGMEPFPDHAYPFPDHAYPFVSIPLSVFDRARRTLDESDSGSDGSATTATTAAEPTLTLPQPSRSAPSSEENCIDTTLTRLNGEPSEKTGNNKISIEQELGALEQLRGSSFPSPSRSPVQILAIGDQTMPTQSETGTGTTKIETAGETPNDKKPEKQLWDYIIRPKSIDDLRRFLKKPHTSEFQDERVRATQHPLFGKFLTSKSMTLHDGLKKWALGSNETEQLQDLRGFFVWLHDTQKNPDHAPDDALPSQAANVADLEHLCNMSTLQAEMNTCAGAHQLAPEVGTEITSAVRNIIHGSSDQSRASPGASGYWKPMFRSGTIPKIVRSDRGQEFKSTLMKEYCALIGLRQKFSGPLRPCELGSTERVRQETQKVLGLLVHDVCRAKSHEWSELLEVKFILDTTPGPAGVAPRDFERGWRLASPLERELLGQERWEFEPNEEQTKLFKTYREIGVKVLGWYAAASERRAERANRFRKAKVIEIGGLVVYRDPRLRSGGRTPWRKQLSDPMRVVAQRGNRVDLEAVKPTDGITARTIRDAHIEDLLLVPPDAMDDVMETKEETLESVGSEPVVEAVPLQRAITEGFLNGGVWNTASARKIDESGYEQRSPALKAELDRLRVYVVANNWRDAAAQAQADESQADRVRVSGVARSEDLPNSDGVALEALWTQRRQESEKNWDGVCSDLSAFRFSGELPMADPRRTAECREAVVAGLGFARDGPGSRRKAAAFWVPGTLRTTVQHVQRDTIPTGPPVKTPPHRLSPEAAEWIDKKIEEEIARGQRVRENSAWGSPPFPTRDSPAHKRAREGRIAVDYKDASWKRVVEPYRMVVENLREN
ncbi:Uncharacterized protein SCF082_LOCUS14946 [Durusdinium trenchii]|uniref:Uncharacterized protein n=1 Tax=Durusdinium trenchii TaxID=1381693 RepID=A0ABP0K2W8_9DINO